MKQIINIKTLSASIHDTNPGDFGYPYKAEATIELDANLWRKFKKQNNLGQLYGIDLSNRIYALTQGMVPAHNPVVDDTKPSRNDIKTLRMTYHFRDHAKAAALGFEQFKFKDGSITPKYGQYINLMERGAK